MASLLPVWKLEITMVLLLHFSHIGLAQIFLLVNGMKLMLRLYQVFKSTILHPSVQILYMVMVIMQRRRSKHTSHSQTTGTLFILMKLNGHQTISAGLSMVKLFVKLYQKTLLVLDSLINLVNFTWTFGHQLGIIGDMDVMQVLCPGMSTTITLKSMHMIITQNNSI